MDSGHGSTSFVPIHDGCVLNKCMAKYSFGGKMMSDVVASTIAEDLRSEINMADVCGLKKSYPDIEIIKSELAPGAGKTTTEEGGEVETGHMIKRGPNPTNAPLDCKVQISPIDGLTETYLNY